MNKIKKLAIGASAVGIMLGSLAGGAFAHNPATFDVETGVPNCHGQLVSVNARNLNDVHVNGKGLKSASEANHPNYGGPGPADSVQDFQNEIRELCE